MNRYTVQGKLRQGRRNGRALYIQEGAEPSDEDVFVGAVDTPELAAFLCEAHNAYVPAMRDLAALPHVSVTRERWSAENGTDLSLLDVVALLREYVPDNSVGAPPEADR